MKWTAPARHRRSRLEPLDVLVFNGLKQRAGRSGARDLQTGVDLQQGHEHKGAFGQARVRQGQFGGVADSITM